MVSLFLITSTNTYLAISGVFGVTTFLQMWLAGLTAMAATWTALYTLWVRHYLVAIECVCTSTSITKQNVTNTADYSKILSGRLAIHNTFWETSLPALAGKLQTHLSNPFWGPSKINVLEVAHRG